MSSLESDVHHDRKFCLAAFETLDTDASPQNIENKVDHILSCMTAMLVLLPTTYKKLGIVGWMKLQGHSAKLDFARTKEAIETQFNHRFIGNDQLSDSIIVLFMNKIRKLNRTDYTGATKNCKSVSGCLSKVRTRSPYTRWLDLELKKFLDLGGNYQEKLRRSGLWAVRDFMTMDHHHPLYLMGRAARDLTNLFGVIPPRLTSEGLRLQLRDGDMEFTNQLVSPMTGQCSKLVTKAKYGYVKEIEAFLRREAGSESEQQDFWADDQPNSFSSRAFSTIMEALTTYEGNNDHLLILLFERVGWRSVVRSSVWYGTELPYRLLNWLGPAACNYLLGGHQLDSKKFPSFEQMTDVILEVDYLPLDLIKLSIDYLWQKDDRPADPSEQST
jgi:hypothetical protein